MRVFSGSDDAIARSLGPLVLYYRFLFSRSQRNRDSHSRLLLRSCFSLIILIIAPVYRLNTTKNNHTTTTPQTTT